MIDTDGQIDRDLAEYFKRDVNEEYECECFFCGYKTNDEREGSVVFVTDKKCSWVCGSCQTEEGA